MYNTAFAFKKQQKEQPKFSLSHVLPRSVLALALFRELGSRLENLLKCPELVKHAESRGWRDQNGWKYQVWNPTLRHLEIDKDKPTVPDAGRASVPLHSAAHGGDGLSSNIPSECFHEVGESQVVEPADGSARMLCAATAWPGLSQGGPKTLTMGPATSRSHPSLTLKLVNTGNTRYMHSVLQVLAWASF